MVFIHAPICCTTASPFKKLTWGRATKKIEGDNSTLYLHVFDWPKDGKLVVPGLKNTVTSAYLLSGPRVQLPVISGGQNALIAVPLAAPDALSSTIVLKLKGAPEIGEQMLTQNADGTLQLGVNEATLHGEQIKVQKAGGKDNIGYWLNANDYIEWQFKAVRAGKYALTSEIAATGSGTVTVSLGDQKFKFTAPNTGDYNTFQKATLGIVEIAAPGNYTLQIKPVADGWQPFNLTNLDIKPAP